MSLEAKYAEMFNPKAFIDVNKTEVSGVDISYDYPDEIDYFASGLEFYIK